MEENLKFARCYYFSEDSVKDVVQTLIGEQQHKAGDKFSVKVIVKEQTPIVYISRNNTEIMKFGLAISSTGPKIDEAGLEKINIMAEKLFREESTYGIKDHDGIDRTVNSIFQSFDTTELFPGIIKKATEYWYKIATKQLFHNGNKRTSLLAGIYMLVLNGFDWLAPDGNNLYEVTKKVALNKGVGIQDEGEIPFSESDLELFIRNNVKVHLYNSLEEAYKSDSGFKMNIKIDKNYDED